MSDGLPETLAGLRGALTRVDLSLELPDVAPARAEVAALLRQLDDYLLPRLARLDAPLLVVVVGPTGAGKSTLVNRIVGRPVSPAGVLRPTTRAPVLVHHPQDQSWFGGHDVLPNLPRADEPGCAGALRLVSHWRVPAGLAPLDRARPRPVVALNRDLATQLLAAADTVAVRDLRGPLRRRGALGGAAGGQRTQHPRSRWSSTGPGRRRGDAAGRPAPHAHRAGAGPMRHSSPWPRPPRRRGLLPDAAVEAIRGWLSALGGDHSARPR